MATETKQLNLRIVTPQGVVFHDEDIVNVTVTTESGEISVYPNHIPLISLLAPGEMVVRKADSELFLAVAHGVLEVRKESEVIVLADRAEHDHDLDAKRAEEARVKAEKALKQSTLSERDRELYERLLEKEENRLEVIRRRNERGNK